MVRLSTLLSLITTTFIISGCATQTTTSHFDWWQCIDEPPVVSTVDIGKGEYEVVACEFPKTERLMIPADEKRHTMWRMPSGKSCFYKRGPDDGKNRGSRNLNKDITTMYGLRYKKTGNMELNCEYDIGFLPVKDLGILGFSSHSPDIQTSASNNRLAIRIFSPEFKNGMIHSDALIFSPRRGSNKNTDYLQYTALLRKANGEIIKKWDAVETQTYDFPYIDKHNNKREISSINFLFDIGDNVAFVYNESKLKTFITDDFADPYSGPYTKQLDRGVRGGIDYINRDEYNYKVRARSKHTLHVIDSKTMSEVKVLKGNEFEIQPMVTEDSKIVWHIIAPLKGTNGLYGLLQEDGTFLPPPGTLGIKPVILNTRISGNKNIYEANVNEYEFTTPRFWLVAYADNKGGYAWGRASADFSSVSEPIWRDVKFKQNGWIFAQRMDNNKWISLDDFNIDVEKTEFTSPGEGLAAIENAIDKVLVARKEQKNKEMLAYRKIQEKAARQAVIDYAQAKQTGNVQAMRVAVSNNSRLMEDFLLSGYASDKEINTFVKYHTFSGNQGTRKILQARIDEKQKLEQLRLEQMRQQAALDERNRKELERLQRYADKRKDLEQWRSTVSKNISKTNSNVQEQWNKHQTDMYKKGYIELPR